MLSLVKMTTAASKTEILQENASVNFAKTCLPDADKDLSNHNERLAVVIVSKIHKMLTDLVV